MSESARAAGSASEHDLAIGALEAELGELFARMRRLYADVAHRVDPRLLPGHYKAFSVIAHRCAITVSGIAEALHVDKAQASRTVRELEEYGLIVRAPDPHDRRVSVLEVSAVGHARLDAARDPRADSILQPLNDWDVADIRTFSRLIRALVDSERAEGRVPSGTMEGSRPRSCEEAP